MCLTLIAFLALSTVSDAGVVSRRQAALDVSANGRLAVVRAEALSTSPIINGPVVNNGRTNVSLGPINDLVMIWLPKRAESKERIRRSICQGWPAELKAKLSLIEGVDAKELNGNISLIMRSPLAHELLGDAMERQAVLVETVFGPLHSNDRVRPTAVNFGHIATWHRVAKGPDEGWTIVLEDDADLKSSAQTISALETITFNVDLSEASLLMLDPRQELDTRSGNCKSCIGGCGSNAYAINKKAAQHLLQNINLGLSIDAFLDHAITMVCPLEQSPFTHEPPRDLMHISGYSFAEAPFERMKLEGQLDTMNSQSDVDVKVCNGF